MFDLSFILADFHSFDLSLLSNDSYPKDALSEGTTSMTQENVFVSETQANSLVQSSGNVFADLGLENTDELFITSHTKSLEPIIPTK